MPLAGCWCGSGRRSPLGPAARRAAAQQQHLQQRRRLTSPCLPACSWSGWWGGTTLCVCHCHLLPSAWALPQQAPPVAAPEALAVSCRRTLSAFSGSPMAAAWMPSWQSCGRTQVRAVSVHWQRRLSHLQAPTAPAQSPLVWLSQMGSSISISLRLRCSQPSCLPARFVAAGVEVAEPDYIYHTTALPQPAGAGVTGGSSSAIPQPVNEGPEMAAAAAAAIPQALPDDSQYSDLWHMPQISAPQAWDTTTGSSQVCRCQQQQGRRAHGMPMAAGSSTSLLVQLQLPQKPFVPCCPAGL